MVISSGIVCDAGISKYGIGGKRVRIKVVNLSNHKILFKESFETDRTINEMELRAIYHSVKLAHYKNIIFSDSQEDIGMIKEGSFNDKEIKDYVECIRNHIYLKDLGIRFWDKKMYGKNPADCRIYKPGRNFHYLYSKGV